MYKNAIDHQVCRFEPQPSLGLSMVLRITAMAFCLIASSGSVFSQSGIPQSPLFATDDILEIRLSGDIKSLMDERTADSKYYPITLSYKDNGNSRQVPVKVKTRGHFRLDRANCFYPPLMLNFSKKKELPAPFTDQDKIKLVTPCKAERYVVQEYLVYKLYNLVTPKSLKARLAKVIYEDSVRGKTTEPLYGILLEDDDQMASRNEAFVTEKKIFRPEATHRDDFLKMAVFEYLIGNTDWSVQYRQNIKLIAKDSMSVPSTVAYDFDHAGIVHAPYAKPAPELMLTSTTTRRYRGFCIDDMTAYKEVFALFNDLKGSIYEVYSGNALLDEKYIKTTLKFLDDFYDTINDPKKAQKEFLYPCAKSGTGNVVIKGLQNN
ncbi:MAG TPA: hypothetical protein VK589_28070 [Chryseolinea sp.]|nr:hypothetical protein [Chryseolinea sp.]